MKKLFILALLTLGLEANAIQITPNEDNCESKIVKSEAYKNGIVKKINGEMVTNQETMSVVINPCNNSVLVELKKESFVLIIYNTDESGTIHAATLDGNQIIRIKINPATNEVESLIGDMIYTTYINQMENNNAIVVEE